jgi:hypothetical protein
VHTLSMKRQRPSALRRRRSLTSLQVVRLCLRARYLGMCPGKLVGDVLAVLLELVDPILSLLPLLFLPPKVCGMSGQE